jgi:hypothetical protein
MRRLSGRGRDDAIAAFFLRPVKGEVGAFQDVAGDGIARLPRGDPDRDRHGNVTGAAVDRERRRLDPLPDALGNGFRRVEGRVRDDHHDLLPAEPGHNVDPARVIADAVSELAQDLVTGIMPIRVIDGLEAVDVEDCGGP